MSWIELYSMSPSVTYETDTNSVNVPTNISLTKLSAYLSEPLSCSVTEERNGSYELELVYPAKGISAELITMNRIIGVQCPLRDSVGTNYFRVYRIERDLGGRMIVYARQLSADLSYYIANQPGLHAISGGITVFADSGRHRGYGYNLRAIANANIPFTFGGDAEYDTSITGVGFQQDWSSCTSIRSYLGGEELNGYDQTALQRFGGEYEFDKWNVNLWESRGVERPVVITYGTNLEDLGASDDMDGVFTAVCFFAATTDGINYEKHCSDVYEYASASAFPFPRVQTVDYSSAVMEYYPDGATDAQIKTFLDNAASAYAQTHYNDLPVRKIEVDVVEAAIGEVYLCDTIKVIYKRNGLDLSASMKVTAYTWDVLMQRYSSLTLGAIQTSLAKEIIDAGEKSDIIALQNVAASTQNAIQELQARYVLKAGDTMTGMLNMNNSALRITAPNIDVNTTPSTNQSSAAYHVKDANGYTVGFWNVRQTTDGLLFAQMGAQRQVGSSVKYNLFHLDLDASGNPSVTVSDQLSWRDGLVAIPGCNSGRRQSIAAGTTSFTPTHNGWIFLQATPTSGQTIPSALAISTGGQRIAMSSGSNNTAVQFGVGAPLQAGVTYTFNAYRCSINQSFFYY